MKAIPMRASCFVLFVLLSIPIVAEAAVGSTDSSVINHVRTDKKVVALTFDADMTPKMLWQLHHGVVPSWYDSNVIKALEDAQVPATLFLTGLWIEAYPSVTEELAGNPLFELGNHSYSHGGFTPHCFKLHWVPEWDDTDEVTKADALLQIHAPHYVHFFRFPGLCFDRDDVVAARKAGYEIIHGDIHGRDGFQKNPNVIVHNVVDQVRPGDIIILHMHGGPNAPETAHALPRIIATLKGRGYTFVKVSELLQLRGK